MEQITKAVEKFGLTDSKEPEPPTSAAGSTPATDAQKSKKEADRRAAQGAQEVSKTEEAFDVSTGKYKKMELIQSKDEDRKRNPIPCFHCS
jgi:hypothetical protein